MVQHLATYAENRVPDEHKKRGKMGQCRVPLRLSIYAARRLSSAAAIAAAEADRARLPRDGFEIITDN